jgi:hypothetical protein
MLGLNLKTESNARLKQNKKGLTERNREKSEKERSAKP